MRIKRKTLIITLGVFIITIATTIFLHYRFTPKQVISRLLKEGNLPQLPQHIKKVEIYSYDGPHGLIDAIRRPKGKPIEVKVELKSSFSAEQKELVTFIRAVRKQAQRGKSIDMDGARYQGESSNGLNWSLFVRNLGSAAWLHLSTASKNSEVFDLAGEPGDVLSVSVQDKLFPVLDQASSAHLYGNPKRELSRKQTKHLLEFLDSDQIDWGDGGRPKEASSLWVVFVFKNGKQAELHFLSGHWSFKGGPDRKYSHSGIHEYLKSK